MEFLGTDADFRAEAKFKAIRKTSGCIDVDRSRINLLLKTACIGIITRTDGLRMFGAVAVVMFERFIQTIDSFD